MLKALVVEDDRPTLFALAELIERHGFTTATASTCEEALDELRGGEQDIVLLDVFLPDGNGLDLLLEIPSRNTPHVLLMSGEESVRRLVDEVALRTVHFVQKPVEPDDLVGVLRRIRRTVRRRARQASTSDRLLGSSSSMEELRGLIAKVAPTDLPVYIEGESGTGKELVAEAVHRGSRRADARFVAINCGALPETLVDSELFGHEKGAFTGASSVHQGVFEQAHGGTLFFDEITEMPPGLQVRLLRVLETGRLRRIGARRDLEVDVRLVAASNRSAERALEEGTLRKDLYHRLCVFTIHVPPLRERGGDIVEIAERILAEISERHGPRKALAPETMSLLEEYRWPGNVRQLRNAIHRAYVVADATITVDDLPPQMRAGSGRLPATRRPRAGTVELEVGSTIADAERALIEATLHQHSGDKRAAASTLGISLRTLYNRLKQFSQGEGEEERIGSVGGP